MRGYIVQILAVTLLSALADIFLPDGNVRRFALPVIGLSVTVAILLPAVSVLQNVPAAENLMPAVENIPDADTYAESVKAEYAKRIAANIMKKGDVTAEVEVGDDFKVKHIHLTGTPSVQVMAYITMELGVPRNYVEIG